MSHTATCLPGACPSAATAPVEAALGVSEGELNNKIAAVMAEAKKRAAARDTAPQQALRQPALFAQPVQTAWRPAQASWQPAPAPAMQRSYPSAHVGGGALLSTGGGTVACGWASRPTAPTMGWGSPLACQPTPPPAAAAVPYFPDDRVFSIDVECVAVGKTHETSSRSPCSVALVDIQGEVLFQAIIKPNVPVVSYLTPITGCSAEDLECGMRLEEALVALKSKLRETQDAVLVGQHPDGDIEWMQLERGRDYACSFDISDVFKGYNHKFGTYSYHSLQHEAEVLLHRSARAGGPHDPVWDAQMSVELYKLARSSSLQEVEHMRQQLINVRPAPSIAKQFDYQLDGVCMAKFMPKMCICGMSCERGARPFEDASGRKPAF